LFEIEPARAGDLEKMAKEKGLVVNISAPFDRETGPKDIEVPDFAKAAFNSHPNSPSRGRSWAKKGLRHRLEQELPSEIPTLEQIRTQVTADYKHNQALFTARISGTEFHTTLTNGLARGKTFSAICADAKVNPWKCPIFTQHAIASGGGGPCKPGRQEWTQANRFQTPRPGTASGFVPRMMAAHSLCKIALAARSGADENRITGFAASVRQNRQNEAFNEWFRKKWKRDCATHRWPASSQQQPGVVSGSGKS